MRALILLALAGLAACNKVEHEPVKVIATARPLPSATDAVAPEQPASIAGPAASASASGATGRTQSVRRPGFIPADQLPPDRGQLAETGNEAFKSAVTKRVCANRPEMASANGVKCN